MTRKQFAKKWGIQIGDDCLVSDCSKQLLEDLNKLIEDEIHKDIDKHTIKPIVWPRNLKDIKRLHIFGIKPDRQV